MAKLIKTRVEVEGQVSEEWALVERPKTIPWDIEQELNVVGKPMPRVDGMARVTGAAHYPSDLRLPGMLHASILRSPHAHARVLRVDTSRAEKLPGVRAVLSRNNAPGKPWRRNCPLFDEVVRYVGDEVAAVAADNPGIAQQACRLIEVVYEPLPFVLDPEQALKPGAPEVHAGGNLLDGEPTEYTRGDTAAALQAAEVVVEGVFETPTQLHNSLETHGSVVEWEGESLTIYDSTGNVHGVRDRMADWLGLPKNRVRVISDYMGGSFGSKNNAGKYTVIAALLARQAGRPVRLFLRRNEENLATGNRAATRQYLKIGASKEGALQAIQLRSYIAVGAYTGWGASVSGPVQEMYACPNVHTLEYSASTHTGPPSAFRAPGYVEGMFALEVLMDELAETLGLDPLELRIRNYAREAPGSHLPYSSNGLLDAYQEGARAIGWEKRQASPRGDGAIYRGIGMASQVWGGSGGPPSYADIKIHPDGTATIITGTQDIGTGTKTILTQIAAEELGLPVKSFEIEIGDTQWGLYSTPSWGSMTAASMGPAVREAAADARKKLLRLAASYLHTAAYRLTIQDGIVRGVKRGKPVEKPLAEILDELDNIMIVGHGSRNPNPTDVAINTFGAQFAEVEVDADTGEVRVLKIAASHDCGRILNPLTASSQIEGGIIQGLGYALMEQRLVDPQTGAVINANLEGYRVPTMLDVPEIEIRMIDRADRAINNLGAKGLGEPPIIPTAPAIVNAVHNALGVRLHTIPLTRDRVLQALDPS